MRILLLNYEFPPIGGGGGHAAYCLAKEFKNFPDLQIDIITSSHEGYREEDFSSNIKIYFLNINKKENCHIQSNWELIKYSWKAYLLGRKLRQRNHYDLIHAFFGIPCGFVALLLRTPYIISLRGSDVPGHNPKFNRVYWLLSPFIKIVWRRARAVIANSDDLQQEALQFSSNQIIQVISNGVDANFFTPRAAERNDHFFRVIYTGRFDVVKGIKYLAGGFKKFSLNKNNVELVLLGGGTLANELIQENRNNKKIKIIELIKHLPQSEIREFYQSADVFVLPSLREGMNNMLLEAMASGLAVIATDTGGAKELIGEEWIVQLKDEVGISDKLNKLYFDAVLLAAIQASNRRHAEILTWDKAARQYKNIYFLCAE